MVLPGLVCLRLREWGTIIWIGSLSWWNFPTQLQKCGASAIVPARQFIFVESILAHIQCNIVLQIPVESKRPKYIAKTQNNGRLSLFEFLFEWQTGCSAVTSALFSSNWNI